MSVHHASHLHAHKKGDAQHLHYREERKLGILLTALLLTFLFAGVEVIAGFWAESLALISDAGHMVTDAASLGLALLAQVIAKRPPSAKHSFGFGRAESLAAFINGLAMLLLVVWIAVEALSRFNAPHDVQGQTVTIVAALGLCINIVVAWVLSKDKKSVNTKAALVHVMGDLLGSLAALIAGVVIHFTGWMQIDAILSLFISALILFSTIRLLREVLHVLMEGVPLHLEVEQVQQAMVETDKVVDVHDVHVWALSSEVIALSAHVVLRDMNDWPEVLTALHHTLQHNFKIEHATIQPELETVSKQYPSSWLSNQHQA